MNWEIVIGLETHAQLSTASKIFSGASTAFGAAANTQASAVDLALPGVLPVLNRGAVDRAIRFGLAVGATINRRSVFARKNYFYPDLPKGYQISQYEIPIVQGGALTIAAAAGDKTVHLTRAHLEEDAGKSLHEILHGKTAIDLNRAGTPLLEIVSEPDMRSAAEAVAYAKALHALVKWIGICDGNMQEGSFRCDANVSVRPAGATKLGTRCEIKNLNSFRFLEQAIEFEVRRQIELIEDGGTVVQETRLFDPERHETRSMRSKEDAHDYRYFPDPDLPPLAIDVAWIERVAAELPELPEAMKTRFETQYALTAYDARALTSSRELATYFEATVRCIARWREARGQLDHGRGNCGAQQGEPRHRRGACFCSAACGTARAYRRWHDLAEDRAGSVRCDVDGSGAHGRNRRGDERRQAQRAFRRCDHRTARLEADLRRERARAHRRRGARRESAIVAEYRAGREKAFNSLVGKAMQATRGKANPAQVNAILKRKV
jgi:aspartyl-tRNA(Asn)/glutamyl-tRNA(Gln) amidotransferase subunit B